MSCSNMDKNIHLQQLCQYINKEINKKNEWSYKEKTVHLLQKCNYFKQVAKDLTVEQKQKYKIAIQKPIF